MPRKSSLGRVAPAAALLVFAAAACSTVTTATAKIDIPAVPAVKLDGIEEIAVGDFLVETPSKEFDVGPGFRIEDNFLHRLKIGASKGALPYFEQEESAERRYLGVFFEMEFVPAGGTK